MLANQRMTNPPKCRGTTQPCNESSSPSWWKPAASTSRSKPLTTTKGLAKGWSRRSLLPSSNAARRAAPTSYGGTKAPSPMTVNHTRSNPPRTKDSALCYCCRATSPTQQLRLHVTGFGSARQAAAKRWRATIEDNIQGHNDFQMRRL